MRSSSSSPTTPFTWSIPNDLDRPDVQPLVLDRVGAVSDGRHGVHHRTDRSSRGWASIKADDDAPLEAEAAQLSADESRGLAICAASGCWRSSFVFGLLTLPAGAPLRNPDDRRADRQLAVHERPDRAHHGAVPGDRRRLRLRRQDDEQLYRRHQGHGEGDVRPGRH